MATGALGDVRHPAIYELNTWPWLTTLSADAGRRIDLAGVPAHVWDGIAELGVDAVWLMGVWERSPASVAIGRADPELVARFRRALPDYDERDVVGSPYSIRRYEVDTHLGGAAALATARRELAARGLGLILDFVPNHVALDHPWTRSHPDAFIRGTVQDLTADPASFVRVGDHVFANGRDPWLPAWTDVVQLNSFSPRMRDLAAATLVDIAGQCDGVRCDMAMLMLDDVVTRTWGDLAGDPPPTAYWDTVIPAVRVRHPDVVFIAEAYWDREPDLQRQGFDFCYDKRLYDLLVAADAAGVRRHLRTEPPRQDGLLRFVENHDEPRAATVFGHDRRLAAVVTALTQPGARLVHDGQVTGARVHLPVQLGRAPHEPVEDTWAAAHRALLDVLADDTFRLGHSRAAAAAGWLDNDTWRHLVAWCWEGSTRWLVIVNLSDAPASGRVATPWRELRGRRLSLVDAADGTLFDRDGDELVDGLHIELGPWGWHLLRVDPRE